MKKELILFASKVAIVAIAFLVVAMIIDDFRIDWIRTVG